MDNFYIVGREQFGFVVDVFWEIGVLVGFGSNDVLFLFLQVIDNDVGIFGEVNYFFSDDFDR